MRETRLYLSFASLVFSAITPLAGDDKLESFRQRMHGFTLHRMEGELRHLIFQREHDRGVILASAERPHSASAFQLPVRPCRFQSLQNIPHNASTELRD